MTNQFDASTGTHRVSEVLQRRFGLWIDTTVASSTGAPPGLEDIEAAIERVQGADAVVLNPGQAERLAGRFGGPRRPGLVVRLDWTNVFRGEAHPIPCCEAMYCAIAQPGDALPLGASVVVATLLLGFDESFEADNVRQVALFTRKACKENIPIAVDVRPLGPRVTDDNRPDTVLLGASMALELGADFIVIPYAGEDALDTVLSFVSVPVVLDIDRVPGGERKALMQAASRTGVKRVLLREGVFASDPVEAEIHAIRTILKDSARDIS